MSDSEKSRSSSDPFQKQEYVDNKFRNGRGQYLTTSLFIDHSYDYNLALYTWKDHDFSNEQGAFPSLKRLYLEMSDVTEYEFANTYLDGWRHWKALLDSPQCRKHIDEWREELELKLRASGLRKMIDIAENEDKPSYQAAKYLAEAEWTGKKSSQQQKNKDKNQRSHLKTAFKSDLDRVANIK